MSGVQLEFGDDERSVALKRAWDRTLSALSNKVGRVTFESYIRAIRPISFDGHEVVLGVSNAFARDWIERRHEETIRAVLETALGLNLTLRFQVVVGDPPPLLYTAPDAESRETYTSASADPPKPKRPGSKPRPSEAQEADPIASLPLNAAFTLDAFVVGRSNRLAHSAAIAVSDAPGTVYNPLFIYGGSGLGKTHLLHAIGNAVLAASPAARVALVDGENFTYHFVSALRERKTEQFRKHYRGVDVWLMDDIQFIAGREQTKEEFFHTFNTLHQTGRQIVIASDRSPRELRAMDERMRSRFQAGLIADVAAPEQETREEILRQRCLRETVCVPEDVVRYIARAIQSNVRTMEGAITRLVAYSSVMRSPICVEMAHDVLSEFFLDVPVPGHSRKDVPVETIMRIVGEGFHVTEEDLIGPMRDRHVACARQVAMYLARDMCRLAYAQIGAAFGGRDHTTVQRGVAKIEGLILKEPALRAMIQELRGLLER